MYLRNDISQISYVKSLVIVSDTASVSVTMIIWIVYAMIWLSWKIFFRMVAILEVFSADFFSVLATELQSNPKFSSLYSLQL